MSLRRNVIANYLGQGWAALMGIAFVPLYVKALGVESYGLVGVFAVLQAWMTLLDLGLTPTLNREMARLRAGAHSCESIRDLLRSLETLSALLAVAMVALVWLLAHWLVDRWLKAGDLSATAMIDSIRLMGFVLATRWLEQVYRGALLGLQDQVWLNATQAVLATLRWGGAYLVVTLLSPTILAFFVWQGIASLLTFATLVHRTYRMLPIGQRSGRFNWQALRTVRTFAAGMFAGAVLSFILTQADKIIISKLLPLDQLGYYMVAATAASGLLQLVLPMNNAIYPRLTEHVTNAEDTDLIRTYLTACEWMSAAIIPPALLLTFLSEPVLLLWTGDAQLTKSVAMLLSLLALGTLCNGLMNLPYMLQLAHGWTSLAVQTNAVAVLVVVPAMLWAVPQFGAVGAAGVWLALNLGYLLFTAHLMYRKLLPQCKWAWYRNAIALPMLAGGTVGLALLALLPVATTRASAAVNVGIGALALFFAVTVSLPAIRRVALHVVGPMIRTRPS